MVHEQSNYSTKYHSRLILQGTKSLAPTLSCVCVNRIKHSTATYKYIYANHSYIILLTTLDSRTAHLYSADEGLYHDSMY